MKRIKNIGIAACILMLLLNGCSRTAKTGSSAQETATSAPTETTAPTQATQDATQPAIENHSGESAQNGDAVQSGADGQTDENGSELVNVVENGPVKIERMDDYYKVTLDFTNSSHYEVGQAYMEAIVTIEPDYMRLCEEIIYEQLITTFRKTYGSYDPLLERINNVSGQMEQDYLDEIQGMSDGNQIKSDGLEVDGSLSWEELMTLQLLPDVVRATQCSGVSVYGDKSITGMPITGRVLEWNLGYDKQLTKLISVTEFVNGDKSFTSIGVLGNLNGITVYNDDGLFLAILDSACNTTFVSENKQSYTYNIRKAAEDLSTAVEAGEYLANLGPEETFSHNVLISDDTTSSVAEICTDETQGICAVRTVESELQPQYTWNHSDSLCVVNSFALKDNLDNLDPGYQAYRWKYYNECLSHFNKMNKESIMKVLTYDDLTKESFLKVYSNNTLFMCVVDASDHSLWLACNPYSADRTKVPEFIQVK